MKPVDWKRVAKRLAADIDVARAAIIGVEQGGDEARVKFIKLTFARVTLENSTIYADRAIKRDKKGQQP